ncbi:hypothetical protein TRFO_20842 [Tritrichomonas foetus]|uniref:Uncharacterized protein n=1 Tax=Tritrichomonas foetus TaxID=1144522 RepID=A0A1J4KKY5_9EUKA|nr:hypothetical protein TRFO_20842 [Tritrichomonas foetus]|eukprot:OHT10037.1 hypothetical protein TRFO_20842 [Tritrichomonas foetus]
MVEHTKILQNQTNHLNILFTNLYHFAMSSKRVNDKPDTGEGSVRDEAMQQKIWKLLSTLLDDITKKNKQKAQHTLQQVQNTYGKYKITFKTENYPKSLIKISLSVSNQLQETTKKVKQFNKIMTDWNKFIEPFKSEIEKCAQNPNKYKDPQFSDDEDERDDQKTKKVNGEVLLRKCEKERKNGQPISVSVSKLQEAILDKETDPELKEQLVTEACTILADDTTGKTLTKGQFEVALDVVDQNRSRKDLTIPVLIRLNKEFIIRSRTVPLENYENDEIIKFKPHLVSLIEKELSLINSNYKKEIDQMVQLLELLCEQKFLDNECDLMSIVSNLLINIPKSSLKQNERLTNTKAKALNYLAIYLASKDLVLESNQVYSKIPLVLEEFKATRLFTLRARAIIGLAAFKHQFYSLSLKMLDVFSKTSQIPKQIGQSPLNVEPFTFLNTQEISIYRQYAKEILDVQAILASRQSQSSVESMGASFSTHFQNLHHILNESKKFDIQLPEICEVDVKEALIYSFLLSSKSAIGDTQFEYLNKNFDISHEKFQEIADKVSLINEGKSVNVKFDKFEDESNKLNHDFVEKFEPLKELI